MGATTLLLQSLNHAETICTKIKRKRQQCYAEGENLAQQSCSKTKCFWHPGNFNFPDIHNHLKQLVKGDDKP